MKQVEYVSIGGYMFALEIDACEMAKAYIDELESFYLKKVSGSEVMEGIEERMAELLLERCGNGGVVNMQTVRDVTAILGRPEAIEEESTDEAQADQFTSPGAEQPRTDTRKEDAPTRKKLYRDPSTGRVAGICSGLGTYLGLDPVIFRVAFVVLTLLGMGINLGFGHIGNLTFPLIYLILWLCMPAAKTVQDRDEMLGNKGTVDEISKRIESGAREVADTAAQFGRSQAGRNLIRIFAVILGFAMLIVGLTGTTASGMFALSNNFFGTKSFLFNKMIENMSGLDPVWVAALSDTQVMCALIAVVAIPFISLLYIGFMLLFDLKEPKWRPGLCLFLLWIVAIVVLAVLLITRFNILHLFV